MYDVFEFDLKNEVYSEAKCPRSKVPHKSDIGYTTQKQFNTVVNFADPERYRTSLFPCANQ